MTHHPFCPCGDSVVEVGDPRAHEWLVGTVTILRFAGEKIKPLHDLNFGRYARFKYMGERRRWASMIPVAGITNWPIRKDAPEDCRRCRGLRYVEHLMVRGRRHTRLCRECGFKRALQVYRVRGPRERQWDEANLIGACRPIMDSLVQRGWLVDDNPKFMKATYHDFPKGPERATVIIVGHEEVVDAPARSG